MPRVKTKPPSPPSNASPLPAVAAKTVDVLTLAEAAAYLRTSPEEVLSLVREQGLPGRRFGEDYRFLKVAVQDWLRAPPSAADKRAFWQTHFGALKGDPHLEEILQEIYRQRGRPEAEE
jgi:excisionase family DNA binding protein